MTQEIHALERVYIKHDQVKSSEGLVGLCPEGLKLAFQRNTARNLGDS